MLARSASVARGEEAAFAGEVRRPVEVVHPGETQVPVERVLHRLDEAVGVLRREAFLPPETEHLDALAVAVDPWLEAADEAFAEEDREHVPAEAAFGGRVEEVPDVVELEERRE